MSTISTVITPDGIHWHVERQGHGPDLVLIPSGEGDCESFVKVAAMLSSSFSVTTFDMPGMSRTTAPPSAFENLTSGVLANQVLGLLDKLSIESAVFYGCSSGGSIIFELVADHPARTRSAIVHEVPLANHEQLYALTKLDDTTVMHACREMYSSFMNADPAAWKALGPAFHSRLDKNYVTWIRQYITQLPLGARSKEELNRRPMTWTIGALSLVGPWIDNIVTACNAGIPISVLPCKHFPQVSIPDKLAEHIRTSVARMEKI